MRLKNKFILFLFILNIFTIINYDVYSQTINCGTVEKGSTETLVSASSSDCQFTINYAPNNDHYNSITKVRVAFHILQKDDGSGNIPNNTAGNQFLDDMMGYLNGFELYNPYPSPGGTGRNISDTRIQYVLTGKYFHTDDTYFNQIPSTFNQNNYLPFIELLYNDLIDQDINSLGFTSFDKNNVLHIWFIEIPNHTRNGQGIADGIPLTYNDKPVAALIDSKDYFDDTQSWGSNGWTLIEEYAIILSHEIGHCFGLRHSDTYQCSDFTAGLLPASGTNNRMGYNRSTSLSECQLGIMYANMFGIISNSRVDDFIIKDWCTNNMNEVINIQNGQDFTWNSKKYLQGDLVIKSGGKLTIKCDVLMPQGGKIIVEGGGRLIIDGGVITNDCGTTWEGIYVYGDPSLTQTYSSGYYPNHGWLIMKNGATIEHAEVAVRAGLYDPVPQYGGGVVQIQESYFLNNWRGVNFNHYSYKNKSYITTSTFECNAPIPGHNGKGSIQLVSMNDVVGIKITGNTFKNTAPDGTFIDGFRSIGINTWDAGYDVERTDDPLTTSAPCDYPDGTGNTFDRLSEGIYYTINVPDRHVRIMNNTFTNVTRPIVGDNSTGGDSIYQNSMVWNQDFIPEMAPFPYYPIIGIKTNNCQGINIKDNTIDWQTAFNGNGIDPVGIWTINSGPALISNINKNTVSNSGGSFFTTGHMFEGNNSNLYLKCNIYSGNAIDWNASAPGNILRDQGNPNTDPNNTFSSTATYHIWYSNTPNLYYYNNTGNPAFVAKTINVLQGNILNNNFFCNPVGICEMYPSGESGGGGDGGEPNMANNSNTYQNQFNFNSTSSFIKMDASISIAPNPSYGEFTLSYQTGKTEGKAEVIIFDALGRMVKRETLAGLNGKHFVSLDKEKQGIYHCILTVNGVQITQSRLMIAK